MSDDKQAAFFLAARRGEVQAVINAVARDPTLLAAKDADNGWTALHLLARLSLALPVQQLVQLGANPEARDTAFRSPLHLAASADASPQIAAGATTPSVKPDQIATLKALLKGGARVTARDSFGMTPLHHAARAGHTDACHFLLSLNMMMRQPRAPLEAETNAEERPLHVASGGGHAVTVRMLLQQGAHHGKTNYLGQVALHLACAGGDAPDFLATVAELIKPEWRADLSTAAADGQTPLHLAAAGGHLQMVKLLLRARDVRREGGGRSVVLGATDRFGRTPAAIARAEGFDDVAVLLEETEQAVKDRAARAEKEQEELLQKAFASTRIDAARSARSRAMGGARGGGMMDAVAEGGEVEGEEVHDHDDDMEAEGAHPVEAT